MNSTVIFRSSIYTACAMRDGALIVTKNRTMQGRKLEQASEWIDAIKTAIDVREGAALCRALFQS